MLVIMDRDVKYTDSLTMKKGDVVDVIAIEESRFKTIDLYEMGIADEKAHLEIRDEDMDRGIFHMALNSGA